MACVTEVYGSAVPRGKGIRLPFGLKGFTRVAVFAATGLVAGSWMMTALGTLETVVPAFAPVAPVMRRVSLNAPQALAVVDHRLAPSRRIRQGFIDAYTADAAYSNLDWRRSKGRMVRLSSPISARIPSSRTSPLIRRPSLNCALIAFGAKSLFWRVFSHSNLLRRPVRLCWPMRRCLPHRTRQRLSAR